MLYSGQSKFVMETVGAKKKWTNQGYSRIKNIFWVDFGWRREKKSWIRSENDSHGHGTGQRGPRFPF